ncbi:stemmadenine O-acetyltransferase-like [Cannabis sativa]|uniref:stemmadenine O-acetyltransferase-like n=1 Tax=Cannabis sativa TaxID=3483 RepID=UPI0029C9ECF4|nr:stemmadenine O-acetyltransferase-like [Cannabis sativa]
MEVSIISSEIVKPSSLQFNDLKPYKLCLFDQITPMTYASIMVFFRNCIDPNSHANIHQTLLSQLKTSLSETLTFYYPFSGRTKNNFYVDDFDAGVTYVEAKVNCSLIEFFKLKQNELLNKFVPFLPWRDETEARQEELPQMGFQVNIFTCGGIALSTSLGHKIADGGTLALFLMSWAASFRGLPQNKILRPNLSDASIAFPPRDLPPSYRNLKDKLWFGAKGNFVTKRFVFDAKALTKLREIASSQRVPQPSRNEVLTCFVWKHASMAAAVVNNNNNNNGFPNKDSVMAHAVNMRPRMKSNALSTSVGNLFWWAKTTPKDIRSLELSEMVEMVRESLVNFSNEYLESIEVDVGSAVSEFYDSIEHIINPLSNKDDDNATEIYAFTNWKGFFNEVDFGWGKPIWVGAHGNVGPEFRNMIVFVDGQGGKGIEAFVTLEEKHMAVLEKDPQFLLFVNPNPEGLPVTLI